MGWRYHPGHTGSHAKCLKYLPAHPWEALVQNSKGFSSWYQVLHNFCKLYIGYHIRHSLDTHLFIPELFGKTILLTYIIFLKMFSVFSVPVWLHFIIIILQGFLFLSYDWCLPESFVQFFFHKIHSHLLSDFSCQQPWCPGASRTKIIIPILQLRKLSFREF